MKAKLIYIVSFLIVFLLTTGAIVRLNSMYKDIFKFDFTPIKQSESNNFLSDTTNVSFAEIKNYLFGNFRRDVLDSLKSYLPPKTKDTVYSNSFQDSSLIDSVRSLKIALKDINAKIEQDVKKDTSQVNAAQTVKQDSSYNQWIKQTAKLYESMDAQKAAKIIQGYSDNVARDIIYSMRQKKAAEILSDLNPDTANRITRAK